jgi:hypothetical protein
VETEGQGEPVEEEEDDEGEENVYTEDDAYNADLDVEDNVMEEAAQDQEIYEELVKITQVVIHPENEEEIRKEMKINIEKLNASAKHQTYMLNQLRKEKAKWRETMHKQKQLEAENENLKNSNINSSQVETFLQTSLNTKEAEVIELTKKLKKAESEHKKAKDQHKAALDTVHDTLGNVTKRNNDLKIEVAKQKSLVTALEEAKDRDADPGEDGSVEDDTGTGVEAQEHNNPSRVLMSNKSKEHRCHACDRVFNAASDLDRHMNDKHSPNECHMCNKTFTTRKQVQEHICTQGDIVAQECDKSYCQKKFVSSQALKNHMKTSHFGNQRFVCNKCEEILNTNHNLKKHSEVCGKAKTIKATERSLEVCKHWRRGRCHWGSQCNFSHVGRQDTPISEHQSTSGAPQACWNGPSCTHLARGKCRFQHQESHGRWQEVQGRRQEVQGRRQEVQGRRQDSQGRRQNLQGARSQRAQCIWGRDCNRVPNCPHLHSLRDFPQYSNQHGFRGTNRPNKSRLSRN